MARIIGDLVNVEVETSEEKFTNKRVVLTVEPREVLVYGVQNRRPVLEARMPYEEFSRAMSKKSPTIIRLENDEWRVSAPQGCACGSPLRRAPLSKDIEAR